MHRYELPGIWANRIQIHTIPLWRINLIDNFKVNDVIHRVVAKFSAAFLPAAKKPFYLKAKHQPELDIHGIASKAAVYNMTTSPRVIEEGLNAGMELMYYLAADGYKIKTPLFKLRIRIPGEYDGIETSLPPGTYAVPKLQVNPVFRNYLKEKVKIIIDGIHENMGRISCAVDEETGRENEVMTIGSILTISGLGLKIEGDEEQKDRIGLYFTPENGEPVKAKVVSLNKARTLMALVPGNLDEGTAYSLAVETRSSVKGSGFLLKNVRTVSSGFSLTAVKQNSARSPEAAAAGEKESARQTARKNQDQ